MAIVHRAAPKPLWADLETDQLFGNDGQRRIEVMLLHFLRGGRLLTLEALKIAESAIQKLKTEENLLRLQGSFTVVGDLHGQLYDLAKVLKLNGLPSTSRYLFLGNCVGGGGFNCEMLLLLMAAKIQYPSNVFLLRGPNESCTTSTAFGLEKECILKYSKAFYSFALQFFESLPLAAVINQKIFCVHGGLSPDIEYIERINSFSRFREVPPKGPICDLLWADPHWDADNPVVVERSPRDDEYYTPGTHFHEMEPDFSPNKKRGRSYVFNFASIKYFMSKNKILCILRSHEVEDNGYKLYRVLPSTNFPCMISVFSAPNYCGSFENMGAVARVGDEITIEKFYCSPCPYSLPINHNGFSWSAPFLNKNILDIFQKIVE